MYSPLGSASEDDGVRNMTEHKKGNGHRPASLEELQKASDEELVEGIGTEEGEVRHLNEAELQRRLNRNVAKLNRRFWMLTGLLFMLNAAMIAAAYMLLRPRIDEEEVYEQARDLLDSARKYANRGLEEAAVLGAIAADRGRDYADVALEQGGRYAGIAAERGRDYADLASERGSTYARKGAIKAGKRMAKVW